MELVNRYYSRYQTAIFTLLLVSGSVKFIFTDINFPIDITLIFSVLIFGDIMLGLLAGSNKNRKFNSNQIFFLTAFIALYVLMLFSLIYTKSENYAYLKTFYFILNLICFIYPIFIIRFDYNLFFKLLLVVLISTSLWYLLKRYLAWYSPDPNVRFYFKSFSGSYLLLSNALSFNFLYCVYKKQTRLAIIIFLIMIALGGRGPIIFIIILLFIWKFKIITNFKVRKRLIKKILYVLLLVLPVLFYFREKILEVFRAGFYRILSFLDYGHDKSVISRLEYLSFTFDKIFDSIASFFFGHGIGSFGVMYNGIDKKEFPHNIFLEAFFELGIMGFILTILIFILPLFIYKKKPIVIKLMCVFFLLHSMKSGSFDGMRFMSAVYGMLIFFSYDVFEKKFN